MTINARNSPDSGALEIVLILDRSGSMKRVRDATIDGVNELVASQTVGEGEAFVTLYQFDQEFEVSFEARPAGLAPQLDERTYRPRGSTALLDAIGEAIERTDLRLEALLDEPKVVLVVVTDGKENSSSRFTKAAIADMIAARRARGWEVMFQGADLDAVREAEQLGVDGRKAAVWERSERGASEALSLAARKLAAVKGGAALSELDFSDEERVRMRRGPES